MSKALRKKPPNHHNRKKECACDRRLTNPVHIKACAAIAAHISTPVKKPPSAPPLQIISISRPWPRHSTAWRIGCCQALLRQHVRPMISRTLERVWFSRHGPVELRPHLISLDRHTTRWKRCTPKPHHRHGSRELKRPDVGGGGPTAGGRPCSCPCLASCPGEMHVHMRTAQYAHGTSLRTIAHTYSFSLARALS